MHVELIVGDITKISSDVIVNAANKSLLGGGGVDGAIHRAAGPGLREECLKLRKEKFSSGLLTGEVALTSAYNLPAKWIIHTVGPIYGVDDIKLLENCYRNALALADSLGAKSIAFPAISTGAFRVPIEVSANVVKKVINERNFLSLQKICLILNKPEHLNQYRQVIVPLA